MTVSNMPENAVYSDSVGYAFAFNADDETKAKVAEHNQQVDQQFIDWWMTKPDQAFVYAHMQKENVYRGPGEVRTWIGTKLGNAFFDRSAIFPTPSGWHSRRRHVIVYGTNGVVYHGWYYVSTGDFARIKAHKNQEQARKEYAILRPEGVSVTG